MNKAATLLVALVIPIVIGCATFLYLRSLMTQPADPNSKEVILYEVLPDQSFRNIAHALEAEGYVKHWRILDVLARLRGDDTKIKTGEYEISKAMSPKDILIKLASGAVFKRVVVVKEGTSVWGIGPILQSAGLNAAKQFEAALSSFELLREAGIRAENFEGYLFPDTYHFSKSDSIRSIIWKMLERGDKLWDVPAMNAAEKLRMTRHEVLTLASIIEKESGNVDEQPKVSSVFHNRLSRGMKLQSDPTVVYGVPDYHGVITQEMLIRSHPYNTYINFGLPPGPICNPGESAIKAALNPVDTRYIYFVADGKGGHVFSEDLEQHNIAVQQYRATKSGSADILEEPSIPVATPPADDGSAVMVPAPSPSPDGALAASDESIPSDAIQ